MVIITRSKKNKKEELLPPTEEGEEPVKSKKKNQPKRCIILRVEKSQAPPRKEESDPDDSSTDGEDEEEEEEFMYGRNILKNPLLLKKANKVSSYIQKKTISLEQILESPIRIKNKAELFELYYIFENAMPNSEERMELRQVIYKMFHDYLKEQNKYEQHKKEIKALEKEETQSSSIVHLQYDIVNLQTCKENKQVIFYKYLELKEKTDHDDEYYKLKKWIQYALDLPYDRIKAYPHLQNGEQLTSVIQRMKHTLDQELYGMKRVKEQILLFLHNKLLYPEMKGCCLGLVGPPGVGKTTIARCLARILDFPFQQISFGGVHNTDFLKGFDYTYVGSQPGEIARCLMRMKYKNGILFFDEYEKISDNKDIVSFLLHLTDFSQNSEYRDNYLSDLVLDLSSMWFLYSMNELPEDKALQDRIFTVNVEGYSAKEKIRILIDFLFPRHLRSQHREPTDVVLSEDTASYIISHYCKEDEKGIRSLERAVQSILHKLSFIISHGNNIDMSFQPKDNTVLSYPVSLTPTLIDILLTDFKEESLKKSPPCHFYL